MGSYLVHHGIQGQKWGVQNGPPYPLDPKSDYNKNEKNIKNYKSHNVYTIENYCDDYLSKISDPNVEKYNQLISEADEKKREAQYWNDETKKALSKYPVNIRKGRKTYDACRSEYLNNINQWRDKLNEATLVEYKIAINVFRNSGNNIIADTIEKLIDRGIKIYDIDDHLNVEMVKDLARTQKILDKKLTNTPLTPDDYDEIFDIDDYLEESSITRKEQTMGSDFKDFSDVGKMYLQHSLNEWKEHKYLYKDENGNYIYPEDVKNGVTNAAKTAASKISSATQKAKTNIANAVAQKANQIKEEVANQTTPKAIAQRKQDLLNSFNEIKSLAVNSKLANNAKTAYTNLKNALEDPELSDKEYAKLKANYDSAVSAIKSAAGNVKSKVSNVANKVNDVSNAKKEWDNIDSMRYDKQDDQYSVTSKDGSQKNYTSEEMNNLKTKANTTVKSIAKNAANSAKSNISNAVSNAKTKANEIVQKGKATYKIAKIHNEAEKAKEKQAAIDAYRVKRASENVNPNGGPSAAKLAQVNDNIAKSSMRKKDYVKNKLSGQQTLEEQSLEKAQKDIANAKASTEGYKVNRTSDSTATKKKDQVKQQVKTMEPTATTKKDIVANKVSAMTPDYSGVTKPSAVVKKASNASTDSGTSAKDTGKTRSDYIKEAAKKAVSTASEKYAKEYEDTQAQEQAQKDAQAEYVAKTLNNISNKLNEGSYNQYQNDQAESQAQKQAAQTVKEAASQLAKSTLQNIGEKQTAADKQAIADQEQAVQDARNAVNNLKGKVEDATWNQLQKMLDKLGK